MHGIGHTAYLNGFRIHATQGRGLGSYPGVRTPGLVLLLLRGKDRFEA
jgi:hypothetical protein